MGWVSDPAAWVGLIALSFLQILLGVDNIVLITILARGLPKEKQDTGRRLGVIAAMLSRILLLLLIVWAAQLAKPFTEFEGIPISVRSILLLFGGLFLVYKAGQEIYADMELKGHEHAETPKVQSMFVILLEIFFLDILFSFDQVLAAIGMSDVLFIQVASVLISVVVMAVCVNQLAKLLEAQPSLRIIALSFLVLVGVSLLADAIDRPVSHGYLYFLMGYAIVVEAMNIRRRVKLERLNKARVEAESEPVE